MYAMFLLWELNSIIDVSRSGDSSALWIKIGEEIVGSCKSKLGGFILVRNYRRAELGRVSVTTILESATEFFRSSVRGSWWAAARVADFSCSKSTYSSRVRHLIVY
jgi:hypothetical protein